MNPSDESFLRLKRSGWSVGDIDGWMPDGSYWLVFGTKGENLLRAEEQTRAKAWRRAIEQVAACGVLAGSPSPHRSVVT
jgi:hypothetical protein